MIIISVYKEMRWDDVRKEYGDKVAFIRDIEVSKAGDPVVVYVYCTLEDIDDVETVIRTRESGTKGYKTKIPRYGVDVLSGDLLSVFEVL